MHRLKQWSREYDVAIDLLDEVHFALVRNNLEEFNASGYDGMTDYVNQDSDHYLWYVGDPEIIFKYRTTCKDGLYEHAQAKMVHVVHPTIL